MNGPYITSNTGGVYITHYGRDGQDIGQWETPGAGWDGALPADLGAWKLAQLRESRRQAWGGLTEDNEFRPPFGHEEATR